MSYILAHEARHDLWLHKASRRKIGILALRLRRRFDELFLLHFCDQFKALVTNVAEGSGLV